MAREAVITQEQVSAVADNIKASGDRPTNRNVRERLGGGSTATILKFFQVWKLGQVQSHMVEPALDMSIISAINNEIAKRVKEATGAMTETLAEMRADTEALIAENERQAAEIEAAIANAAVEADRYALQTGRMQQLEAESARSEMVIADLRKSVEVAKMQIAKSELRLEAVPHIESDLAEARACLETERINSAQMHEAAAVALAKLEAVEMHAARLTDQLTLANKATDEASKRAKTAAEQLSDAKMLIITLQSKLEVITSKQTSIEGEASNEKSEQAPKRGRPAKAKLV